MAEYHPTDVEEIWKTIQDIPNYEVSNMGRVRRTAPGRGTHAGRIMGLHPKHDGYLRVILTRNGQAVFRHVHRLVAEAFHGPCPPDYQCNHIDGVKTNNRADNLEWTTFEANKAHAIAMGLWNSRGSNHPLAKLTEEQVEEIKRALKNGESQASLARKYRVSGMTIGDIKRGVRWKHVN